MPFNCWGKAFQLQEHLLLRGFRIFVTDMGIGEAFSQSFQVVYRSENGLSFVGLEVLTAIVAGLLALATCGLGGFVVIPMASFFLQNVAYERGLLR